MAARQGVWKKGRGLGSLIVENRFSRECLTAAGVTILLHHHRIVKRAMKSMKTGYLWECHKYEVDMAGSEAVKTRVPYHTSVRYHQRAENDTDRGHPSVRSVEDRNLIHC